jgi:hypothetical protein
MELFLYSLPFGTALASWLGFKSVIWVACKKDLINTLASTAAQELANTDTIAQQLSEIDVRPEVSQLLSERLDTVLEKFKERTPMVALFLNDSVKATIKELVLAEVISEIPELQKTLIKRGLEHLDVNTMIKSKIEAFDLHALLTPALCSAQLLAAATGFGVGILQLLVYFFCCMT